MITNVYWFNAKRLYYSQVLMKPEFSRQTFGKSSNIKFLKNPSRESPVLKCGQTDGRTNGRTQQS